MNIRNLFIFVCFTTTMVKAQEIDSTARFDFDKKGWPEWTTESSSVQIKNGFLELEHKRSEGSWAFWNYFKNNLNADFEIETSLQWISGETEYGYGIIWGYKDWDNYNAFLISPNGYININSTVKGEYKEQQEWKTNSAVVANGTNKLKIIKEGKTVRFLINDTEVGKFSSSKIQVPGGYCGMVIYRNMKVKADYFQVKGKYKQLLLVKDAIKGYVKENLGTEINCTAPDMGPMITSDGNTMYFFRKEYAGNTGGTADDIWYCKRNADGTWGKAQNIGFPLNNSGHNLLASVSADNNTLYLTNTYNADGSIKSAGLSVSYRTDKGWTIPRDIEIKNFYNTHQYVNFCLSQDNRFLVQAIQRKDSRGDADIYVSMKKSDGTYSEPMNLGDIINTTGYETTPFLAADNTTLYFSSDGHPGYGSNDVFVTKRLDDTWKNWSTPRNLGPEINTDGWDAYFTIPASGELAYMVEPHATRGDGELVRIKLPESARPNPVALIKGKVYNKKTNSPIGAKINYIDLSDNSIAGEAVSNPVTGEYTIVLQYGKKYSFRADKEGYYAINDFLDLSEVKAYTEITRDLFLVPVEVGQVVRLNNIFFDLNKTDIKPESAEELDRLVKFLNDNKSVTIEISGHTDNQGADEYNKTLSHQRSESVVNYLVSKQIDKSRLSFKGYGETKPLVKNDTPENMAINRRVEFTILKQ